MLRNELDWVVLKALEKDRTHRYESATGFARDIQRYLTDEPVEARPPSRGYRLRKFVKRNKGQVLAASLLLLALIGGVTAVLIVQARANSDLAAKNAELAIEQGKVQARFELAQKAIETFHTGVSEDVLLKNDQFKDLRNKLLKTAADFYGEMQKLLEGQTDARSRKALGAGYFKLGQLTEKIGSLPEALAVHQKSLSVRRELAAEAGADLETQMNVARSLDEIGKLMNATSDRAQALAVMGEQLELGERLAAVASTDEIEQIRAKSHDGIANVLARMGKEKLKDALAEYENARVIYEKLAAAHPDNPEFQNSLGESYFSIGIVYRDLGKLDEALAAAKKTRTIRQTLVDAYSGNNEYKRCLAEGIHLVADVLEYTDLAEAVAMQKKGLAIRQEVADANRAVNDDQLYLSWGHSSLGNMLSAMGKPVEALREYEKARDIQQKLVDANPTATRIGYQLFVTQSNIGEMLKLAGKWGEALTAREKARDSIEKLVDIDRDASFQVDLADCYMNIGLLHAHEKRFIAAIDHGLVLMHKLPLAEQELAFRVRGLSHAFRGCVLVRAGQFTVAAADLRRALELWAKDPAPMLDIRVEVARTQTLLAGLGGKAETGVTSAEAAVFAGQAVASLREAVKIGWAQPELL